MRHKDGRSWDLIVHLFEEIPEIGGLAGDNILWSDLDDPNAPVRLLRVLDPRLVDSLVPRRLR